MSIRAELVRATRPHAQSTVGLATFIVEVPVYIWTELLTHKRFARNASSSRAQSQKRHAAMGYYTPEVFYEQGEFMRAGQPIDGLTALAVEAEWRALHAEVLERVKRIDGMVRFMGYPGGLAKEQINRLLPTTKMVRGVVTATEDGRLQFLKLRHNETADTAMQLLADQIAGVLASEALSWELSIAHIPFDSEPSAPATLNDYYQRANLAAARLARVSNGAPGPGQRPDSELAALLREQRHWSPFEHIARWDAYPRQSALCSVAADLEVDDMVLGWVNYRSELEVL